jgi:hypothetical protein
MLLQYFFLPYHADLEQPVAHRGQLLAARTSKTLKRPQTVQLVFIPQDMCNGYEYTHTYTTGPALQRVAFLKGWKTGGCEGFWSRCKVGPQNKSVALRFPLVVAFRWHPSIPTKYPFQESRSVWPSSSTDAWKSISLISIIVHCASPAGRRVIAAHNQRKDGACPAPAP